MQLNEGQTQFVIDLLRFGWAKGAYATEDAGVAAAVLRRQLEQSLQKPKDAAPPKMELVDKPAAIAQ